ncbi:MULTISPECIES: RsiV family protein [Mycobacterium]|nr:MULTISPECIES: RsiV family protein [Mycobacterium]GLB90557.1 hypothetical protein SRL2020130_33740 [Mycobacterium kiyosense]GLC00233.1 hypothetical protein SRL2020400_08240 [Mycobacterium kiyosense]GLC08291.1 hypothetical protein SRL2020411_29370 [Mycobacterium kiyosense]GLC20178.1 hypothetical protein SRL2020472_27490 [Mycobacterium kiyosense]GLD06221.1 hypothetical protein Mkiyose1383_25470 [Mycobacterium kiyosense]
MKLVMAGLGALAAVASVATLVTAPAATAAADQFCSELAATWDGARCTTVVTSQLKAERLISFDLPEPMLDNPTSGPAVRGFYHKLMDGWRHSGAEAPRDSRASADYQLYAGPGAVQSLIVHEVLEPFGLQANNAYRSFVFDMAQGRRLMIADLFKPGVDPLSAIPPATEAILPGALDAAAPPHPPNNYPFTVAEWTPGPNGLGFTGGYQAFALTPDSLILYMPDAPMQQGNPRPGRSSTLNPAWSMDGGTVTIQVPLSALAGSLRPEFGGA